MDDAKSKEGGQGADQRADGHGEGGAEEIGHEAGFQAAEGIIPPLARPRISSGTMDCRTVFDVKETARRKPNDCNRSDIRDSRISMPSQLALMHRKRLTIEPRSEDEAELRGQVAFPSATLRGGQALETRTEEGW